MGDSYRRSVKIFIGGLSFETTDEALKRYFEQFGPVADAIVMKDAVSRRSRGFGFITYMNTASVDAALSVEQHIVDNRRVEAKRAVPRSEVPKMDPTLTASPLLQPMQGAWDPGFGMDGVILRGIPDSTRTRSNSTVSTSSMGGLAGLDGASMACKIFVGGLHYETRDASLQAYFEQFGPVTTAEVMFNRETHKSRGFGFVVFESEESANAVLQSTHHTVNGKVVEVKRAVPRSQSSTGGSNPSSPALVGYPPSPSALGPMGNPLTKAAKRAQRTRTPRDPMMPVTTGIGHPPPGASPQRYAPATSYAAALRYGAGRQQLSSLTPHLGGKPPQHHGHMQTREELGGLRLHGSHPGYLPPGAAARAEAAAAHAYVQELKAWDVDNPDGLSLDDSFDYYPEHRALQGDYNTQGDTASGETMYSGSWPGPGPGSGPRAWAHASQSGSTGPQTFRSEPGRLISHSRLDRTSPRHGGHSSTLYRQAEELYGGDAADSANLLYRSPSIHAADEYRNGRSRKSMGESQNSRQLSPGEGGGTPALMGSSPLLGGGGLLETAFAELSLDGTGSSSVRPSFDGMPPNGDGPSLLSDIGGGGPPSTSSEVLPYGRTGGEIAPDGHGDTDALGASGSWRADAFGSALGVSVASAGEGKDLSSGGLGERYVSAVGAENRDGPTGQLTWR